MRAKKINFARPAINPEYFYKHYMPWIGAVFLFLILIVGLFVWRYSFIKKELQGNLINKTQIINDAVSTNFLKRISSPKKYDEQVFRNNIVQLDIYQNYHDGENIYFIRTDTDGGRIALTSETETAKYKLEEIYSDPAKLYQITLESGKPQISKPYLLNGQQWITVLFPFLKEQNHEIQLLGGVDFPASEYISQLRKTMLSGILVVSILVLFYIIVLFSIIWRDQQTFTIKQKFRHIETFAVLVAGLFLTTGALHINEDLSRQERSLIFKNIASVQQMNAHKNFLELQKSLTLLVSFLQNKNSVERNEFINFSSSLSQLEQAETVLLFDLRTTPENDDSFWDKMLLSENMHLHFEYEYSAEGQRPEDSFFIKNTAIIRHVISDAIKNKSVAASSILIDENTPAQKGYIAVAYPFTKNNRNNSPDNVQDSFGGIIFALLNLQKVFDKTFSKSIYSSDLVDIVFFELNDRNTYKQLASYPSEKPGTEQHDTSPKNKESHLHEQMIPLFMFGKIYGIKAHCTQGLESQYVAFRKRSIILSGFIFTLALVVLTTITRGRWLLMEKLIHKRTQSLNRKIKDLVCLQKISEMRHKKHLPETFLPAVARILKQNYPDEVKAVSLRYMNIEYGDQLKKNDNSQIFNLKLKVTGKQSGSISIVVSPEYVFSKSDEKQLKQIVEKVSIWLEHYTVSRNFKESEEKFKTFIDNAVDGIYLLRGRQFIYVNKSYQNMLGYTKEELLSASFNMDVLLTDRSREVFEMRYNARQQGQKVPNSYEFQYRTKSGQIREAQVDVISLPGGDKLTVMGISHDITEKKEAQQALFESQNKLQEQNIELLRLNDELLKINNRTWKLNQELTAARLKAEAASRIKTAFLNNISHEVRTPLNGIVGASALISDAEITSEERQELTEIINRSSKRLVSTITHYMDISLLQSGEIVPHRKTFYLNEIISSLEDRFRHKAEAKGIDFKITFEPYCEKKYIHSDKELIEKMLVHILDNAFKFTPQGSIDFLVKSDNSYISFEIRDTGIGIEPEFHTQIYNYFVQEDGGNTRKYEGSGLGLAISKGIVSLLGGNITFSSQKNIGTTFCVRIPATEVNSVFSESSETTFLPKVEKESGPLILIAEDEELSFSIINKFLRKKLDANIIRAENGREAVDNVKNNREISLALMDLKMPVMDGYHATRIIKAIRPELPVIAITTYGLTGDETKAIDAGCDDYLAKPVNTVELLEKIERHLSKEYLERANRIQKKYRS